MDNYSNYSLIGTLVAGGTAAIPREFPFIIQIMVKTNSDWEHHCGGTLISTIMIISAAHCFNSSSDLSKYRVIGGKHSLKVYSSKHQTRYISRIYTISKYKHSKESPPYDIAALIVKRPFDYSPTVNCIQPLKLSLNSTNKGIVAGWGNVAFNEEFDELRKGNVTLLNSHKCQTTINKFGMGEFKKLNGSVLCGDYSGATICQGDSGGPLICKNHEGFDRLCGVISFGSKNCRNDTLSGFSSISHYWPWIKHYPMQNQLFKAVQLSSQQFCKNEFFRCNFNSKIMSNLFQCDGENDCGDGSDEIQCGNCSELEFRCKSGICVNSTLVCNRVNDCEDKSDEFNCPSMCAKNEFMCKNQRCINSSLLCNSANDCFDGSDELGCKSCEKNYFSCFENDKCIENDFVCDKENDCIDDFGSSDEENCDFCTKEEFRCSNGACIYKTDICDSYKDCKDGMDEFHCIDNNINNVDCKCENKFRCQGKENHECKCLKQELVCNGENDCGDGSDELNCANCGFNYFMCKNGNCIPFKFICNGNDDCGDDSDEINCSNKKELICNEVVVSNNLEFKCNSVTECNEGLDELGCGICPENEFKCSRNLLLPNITNGNEIRNSFYGNLFNEEINNCLSIDFVCDDFNDCKDGSDEFGCKKCKTNEFSCNTYNECVNKDKMCNSVKDCIDGSDEVGCGNCTMFEFKCLTNINCVHFLSVCNGTHDCKDGSDEKDCNSVENH